MGGYSAKSEAFLLSTGGMACSRQVRLSFLNLRDSTGTMPTLKETLSHSDLPLQIAVAQVAEFG
jgi:hypothetical protein